MRVILATAGAGGTPATGAGGTLAGILLGPQRITAFKPPYFADRYIENIWMAANKAGKEHRLGRKGIVQRIQTELVRLPIVLEDSERLPVDACLFWAVSSAAAATI